MSEHCKQDGGFIGDAGCTHPNHQHSELVRGLLAASEPRGHLHDITPEDFDKVLEKRDQILAAFKKIGFTYISLDLQGFRSGSMNETLAAK